MALKTVEQVYSTYAPPGPVFALQFATIFLMIAWMVVLMIQDQANVLGGLVANGLFSLGFLMAIRILLEFWNHADLFLRVLPPALYAAYLIDETRRLRRIRQENGGKISLAGPAFTWLKKIKAIIKRKGGDV